ncbi:MFS transporter [Alkalinema sp. FACHB-956]|uniref:MFS transporter n=1 Tax=Alkalinema sp. FACHB-956 TaxID=2692768 RepID=UPI001683BF73|nr:MFS transporter [Alkalinema sp. FACHB-956]
MHPVSQQPQSTGFSALLRDRAFMQLWIGQICSQLADKIFLTLQVSLLTENLRYQAFEINMGSIQWALDPNSRLLILFIASTIPAILFGSAAGIFVDRRRKKSVLFHCNLWRAIMLLLLPFIPGGFPLLVVIVFAESVLTQFFAPAEQSVLPFLVARENLIAANSLFATTMIGSIVVGHAVASPIFDLVEYLSRGLGNLPFEFGKEFTVGLLYLAGAIILARLPMRETRQRAEDTLHPWQDFKAGLAYLRKDRLVSNAIVQLMIIYSVFASLTVLSIALTSKIQISPGQKLQADQFGFLIAAAGVGMILGATLLNVMGDRFHHKPLPLIGFLSVSFALFCFAFIHQLAIALVLSAFLGLGSVLIVVPMQTLIQQQTPASMRGKVFGFQNNVINIAISLPLVLTEFFVKLSPPLDPTNPNSPRDPGFVLLGISVIVAAIGIWTWRRSRQVFQDVL